MYFLKFFSDGVRRWLRAGVKNRARTLRAQISQGHVLPFENEWEWERERLSCSLFAGDDDRRHNGSNEKNQTQKKNRLALIGHSCDALFPIPRALQSEAMMTLTLQCNGVRSYRCRLCCCRWRHSGRWGASGGALRSCRRSSTGLRWSPGPRIARWRNPPTLSRPARSLPLADTQTKRSHKKHNCLTGKNISWEE